MLGNLSNTIAPDSIAFIDYTRGIVHAYSYDYYLKHGTEIHSQLEGIELARNEADAPLRQERSFRLSGIFFKVTPKNNETYELNTWIDLNSCLRSSTIMSAVDLGDCDGKFHKAIAEAAYSMSLFKVYPSRYIPHGYYTDIHGMCREVAINDGHRDDTVKEVLQEYTKNSFTYDFFQSVDRYIGPTMVSSNSALTTSMRFSMVDIENCDTENILYVVNGMFFGSGYNNLLGKSPDHSIAYIDGIRDLLEVDTPFKNPLLADDHEDQNLDTYYMSSPKLFKWQNTVISDPLIGQAITPIQSVKVTPKGNDDLPVIVDGTPTEIMLLCPSTMNVTHIRERMVMLFHGLSDSQIGSIDILDTANTRAINTWATVGESGGYMNFNASPSANWTYPLNFVRVTVTGDCYTQWNRIIASNRNTPIDHSDIYLLIPNSSTVTADDITSEEYTEITTVLGYPPYGSSTDYSHAVFVEDVPLVVDGIASFDLSFGRPFGAYMLFYHNMWIPSMRSTVSASTKLRLDPGVPEYLTDLDFAQEYNNVYQDAGKFWVLEFTAVNDDEEVIIDQGEGIPNFNGRHNLVRFTKPIVNALITYNGLALKYTIVDPYTIEYSTGRYSISKKVASDHPGYEGGVESDAQIVAHTVHIRKK